MGDGHFKFGAKIWVDGSVDGEDRREGEKDGADERKDEGDEHRGRAVLEVEMGDAEC